MARSRVVKEEPFSLGNTIIEIANIVKKEKEDKIQEILNDKNIKYIFDKKTYTLHYKTCEDIQHISVNNMLALEQIVDHIHCPSCHIECYVALGTEQDNVTEVANFFRTNGPVYDYFLKKLYVECNARTKCYRNVLEIECREDRWKLLKINEELILFHNSYKTKNKGENRIVNKEHCSFHVQIPNCTLAVAINEICNYTFEGAKLKHKKFKSKERNKQNMTNTDLKTNDEEIKSLRKELDTINQVTNIFDGINTTVNKDIDTSFNAQKEQLQKELESLKKSEKELKKVLTEDLEAAMPKTGEEDISSEIVNSGIRQNILKKKQLDCINQLTSLMDKVNKKDENESMSEKIDEVQKEIQELTEKYNAYGKELDEERDKVHRLTQGIRNSIKSDVVEETSEVKVDSKKIEENTKEESLQDKEPVKVKKSIIEDDTECKLDNLTKISIGITAGLLLVSSLVALKIFKKK